MPPGAAHLLTERFCQAPQFDRAVLVLLAASGVTLVVRAFTGQG